MRRRNRILLDTAGIGPALVLGLLVAVAALLFITGQTHQYQVGTCLTKAGHPPPQPPSQPEWWGTALLAANLAGFAIGHATAHIRGRIEAHRPLPASVRVGSRIVQSVLIVGLAGAALLTAYETLSVVPDVSTPAAWPLSYYVRCVNDVNPVPTLLGTAVISFLLGHWLCHPGRRPRSESA